ncbi:MAG TPA: ATP-binding protein [Thermoplasmata archaeon]|nr:ATP-binding protein [Thermoplasmata archaeon]
MTAPSPRPRAVVSWSSGKDSAFALHEVRRSGRFEVVGLLTTVTETYQRVSMHGVRESILDAQARAVGLPLRKVEIPSPCPNEVYERAMSRAVAELRDASVTHLVFGDLFLEDIRAYREDRLRGTGLTPVFPLWGRPTPSLAREMIDAGLDARIVALDPRAVPREIAGHRFDRELLDRLPATVDPCGERGEFHTCVVDGPMFSRPIPVRAGEVVERDGFVFADLVPAELSPAARAP